MLAIVAGAVAVRRDHLDVEAGQVRRLVDRLAAAAAGRHRIVAGQRAVRDMAAGDGDPRHLVEPERLARGGQRGNLGADAEPVAGILHIRAGDDLAVDRLDRAADAEPRIRRIGLERGGAGRSTRLHVFPSLVSCAPSDRRS